MTDAKAAPLYTPDLLALAVQLADYPFDETAPAIGEARSRTCGSSLLLSSGTVDRLSGVGLRVTACAVGQAAAAIFAGAAQGLTAEQASASLRELEAWLAGGGARPDWPGIGALDAVVEHRGRHGAIVLPWRAAIAALSKPSGPR